MFVDELDVADGGLGFALADSRPFSAYRFLSHQPKCSAAAFAKKRPATLRSVVALALLNFRCVETPTENHLEQPLRLLTLQETAELLQVSQRTVNRMIQDKKLPAFKVGGQWRVRESQLSKWLQGLNEL
jgi:excisionase family DNA binding protein